VSIPQFATYRLNFTFPDHFIPERWLSHPTTASTPTSFQDFSADDKSALNPFSYGPRNCLGKNMAMHEIRLVLVKLLFNFEFTLGEGMEGWAERQGSYGIWEKGPLVCGAKVRS